MRRQAEGISLFADIPKAKFDGKTFDYFLDANDVAYYKDDKGKYIFANMMQRLFASRIWETLTGSAVLGRYLNLA